MLKESPIPDVMLSSTFKGVMSDRVASGGWRIVLFEDNANDVELIRWALERTFPCSITAAKRLETYAIEISRQPGPDLIICDGCEVDGEAALTYARTQCPQTPFIFCSGNDAEAKKLAARAQGVGWIVKDEGF